jgi:lysophospholipase L1-like esterase
MSGRAVCAVAAVALCALVAAAVADPGGTSRLTRYVALGDSFSSGDGNPPYRAGTDRLLFPHDKCHRSNFAYGSIVHGSRGGPWAFWACSGARIPDMTSRSRENPVEGAQLDRIAPPGKSDPSVGLVTLTIGGNDAEFGVAAVCIASRLAVPLLCHGDWQKAVSAATERLRTSLPPVLRTLRARAPDARILLLGYPDPFPTAVSPGSRCSAWFATGDIAWANRESVALNAAIRTAARTSGARITFVSPTGFAGHDVCSRDPWFNAVYLEPSRVSGSFHPNVLGQRRLARDVLARI